MMFIKDNLALHYRHKFQYLRPGFFLYKDLNPVSFRYLFISEAQTCAGYGLSAVSPAVYEKGCVVIVHYISQKTPVFYPFPQHKGKGKNK